MLSPKPLRLAYCDYIARMIYDNLLAIDKEAMLEMVKKIKYDIGPECEFLSTTKTIDVVDFQGKEYRITVQEL